jgi:hypothetical protein
LVGILNYPLSSAQVSKKELWDIIQSVKKSYVTDELIRANGHIILRIPPYNCQYNPIELAMAWGFLKSFYNKHIPFCAEAKGRRVKQMWQKAIDHFTPEMWHNSVCHCEDIIREDWRKLVGNAPIEDIPPIIIRLGEDSDSEEETGDSDTDSSSENE